MQIRGNNPNGFNSKTSDSYTVYFTFTPQSGTAATANLSGDIMSLIAYDSETNTINDDMQLPDYCFYNVFKSALSYIKNSENLRLPATNLSKYCYGAMFYGAVNMITCPKELPATVLPEGCYKQMFYNNNKVNYTKAPDIKATTYGGTSIQSLSDNAMFYAQSSNPNKLNYIRVYRTTWNTSYSSNWVQGVQTSSGSFYCPPQLTRTRGNSYIPNNWKVYSYDLTFHLQSGAWTDETSEDRQYTWRTDVSDVTTFLTNEVAAGTRFYSDAACTSELTQSYIESQLSELQNTTTWTIYVNGGTTATSTYPVHIATPANGTITVKNGNTVINDGDEVEGGTTLTVTCSAATGYHFSAWTNDGAASVTVNGEVTIGATFAPNTHRLTWTTDGNTLTGDYTHGEAIAYGTPVTPPATPTKNATAEYTYTFSAWSPAVDATMPDNDVEYTATWTATPRTYTVTWKNADGTTLETDNNVAYNATPEYNGTTPTKASDLVYDYTFAGWSPAPAAVTADAVYTAQYETSELTGFDLYDDKNAGDDFYTALAALENKTRNVRYMRTLEADKWYVFSLPFSLDLLDTSNPFYGCVYTFDGATYEADGTLSFNFFSHTLSTVPNRPYIYYRSGTTVTNPVFNGVTIVASELSAADTKDITGGSVSFVNTIVRTQLTDLLTENKRLIYINNNTLYYPKDGSNVWMRAFRGYFTLNKVDIRYVNPRVRIVMDGQTVTEIETAGAMEDASVCKYVQDGMLLIERNGVVYNAQGAVVR